MSFDSFKEVTEITVTRFSECPLGRMAEDKTFEKPVSEYDKPFAKTDYVGEEDRSNRSAGETSETPKTVTKGDNVDSKSENTEVKEKHGGSYREVFKAGEGATNEVHHMPADSISKLETNDGPAIKMEKEDHKETASYGRSKEAEMYRDKQKALIEQGKFREAVQMDIDDIREKFGDKYDEGIAQMLEYVDKLEAEGKIDA